MIGVANVTKEIGQLSVSDSINVSVELHYLLETLGNIGIIRLCIFTSQKRNTPFEGWKSQVLDDGHSIIITDKTRSPPVCVATIVLATVVDKSWCVCTVRKDHFEIKLRPPPETDRHSKDAAESSWDVDDVTLPRCSSEDPIVFICKRCRSILSKPITVALALPSPGWREAAEDWFCGSCCGPQEEDKHQILEKLEEGLTPSPSTSLVGSTVYLLTESDVPVSSVAISSVPTQPGDETSDVDWRVAACSECTSVIGIMGCEEAPDLDSNGAVDEFQGFPKYSGDGKGPRDSESVITLFKHRVVPTQSLKEERSGGYEAGSFSLENCFVEDILAASQLHGSMRFSLYKLSGPEPVVRLVLLSTDASIASGTLGGADAAGANEEERGALNVEMRACIKVLFQEVTTVSESPGDKNQPGDSAAAAAEEELRMVPSELDELLHILRESNQAIPESCRRFNGYQIGHLYYSRQACDDSNSQPDVSSYKYAVGTNEVPVGSQTAPSLDKISSRKSPDAILPPPPPPHLPPPPPPPNGPGESAGARVDSLPMNFSASRQNMRKMRMQWGTFCIDKLCDDCEPGLGGRKPAESHLKRR